MPKYTLYGSVDNTLNNDASNNTSKSSYTSPAFDISPQKAKFSNKVKPLTGANMEATSKSLAVSLGR